MRRRSWWVWVSGLAVAVLVVAHTLALGARGLLAEEVSNEPFYKETNLFAEALDLVRSDYVEQPEAKQLIYGALKGMLATLDPYSQFLDPDSYNELKVETEGQFGGLGIEITVKDDLLTVISPIDDTPAYQAGMQPGDRIVKIDGELTRGITLLEAVKKLRGKPHTSVTLTILREHESALKEVTLERAIIKVQSVREASLLDDHIGYIRLSDFRERTTKDLEEAIARLQGQTLDGLVFDLRNNPGGLLDEAVSVAELFLERNQPIVTTKGRLRNQNLEFHSRITGPLNKVPLVVLINEGSASASEIVAGAIQDLHRGVVIGTKSHGKASVQTIFPLRDGSALKLTTSKYFTPNGRSIHGQGIAPDVEVALERRPENPVDGKADGKDGKTEADQADALFDRIESTPKDQSPEAVMRRKKLDNQLARAVDLLKGIKVYQSHRHTTD